MIINNMRTDNGREEMATTFWKWKADGQVVTGLAELRRSNAQREWRNPEPIWLTSQNPRPPGIGAAGSRGWGWSWIQEDVVKVYGTVVGLWSPGLPGDWGVLLPALSGEVFYWKYELEPATVLSQLSSEGKKSWKKSLKKISRKWRTWVSRLKKST